MKESIEKALEFSNYQKTLQIQKDNLKLRLEHMLVFKFENNIFKCNVELINLVNSYESEDYIIIEDCNNNPVKINDLHTFKFELKYVYYKAYDEYYDEYEKLKKARSVKKIVS